MTEEITLKVTDLEMKAIAFCREKDVPFPIANYLVTFATEVTKKLQKENEKLKARNAELKGKYAYEARSAGTYKQFLDSKDNQLTEAKELLKEVNEGLSKLYLSGLSYQQITFIEKLQDKVEVFFNEE